MLKKEKLYDYLDEHWFLMLSHLVAFPVSHDQEELHRLRVEIKKIRTLAWFITKTNSSKDFDRSMEPLKNVFRSAGKVRSNYIRLLQLEQFIPDQNHRQIRKNIGRESQKFTVNLGQHVRSIDRSYITLRKNAHDIKTGSIEKLYKKQLDKIQKELGTKENWHEGRKRLKRLMYVYEMLPKKINQHLHFDDDSVDKLQELIGKWHDLVVSLPEMKKKINRAAYAELEEQGLAAAEKIRTNAKHFSKKVSKA